MKRIIYLILTIGCLMAGCVGKEKRNGEAEAELILDLDTSPKNYVNPNTVFDNVSFVTLETTSNSYLGMEFQCEFTDERIIVTDYSSGRILFFSLDGKHQNTIRKVGRGPGEYVSFGQVMVDSDRNNILVYDLRAQKVLHYDFEGNFIKEIEKFSNGHFIREMTNLPDGGFLCYNWYLNDSEKDEEMPSSGLWRVDPDGKIVEHYFQKPKAHDWGVTDQYTPFQKVNDRIVSLRDLHSGDVYHYDNKTHKVEKYATYKLPITLADQGDGMFEDLDENFFWPLHMQESDDYMLSWWINKTASWLWSFYDKKTQKMTYMRMPFDFSDSNLTAIPCFPVNTNRKDVLVTQISGEDILACLKDPATPQRTKDTMNELVAGKSEEQILGMNPVFQLLHFKK